MIDYVIAHNPDDRVLNKAKVAIEQGELICVPTETNWQVLANPYIKDAVEKLYLIKKENHSKHFSLLCPNISVASELAHIDNKAYKILKKIIPGHYTFIFEAKKLMAKNLKASKSDKEIGIRFVPCELMTKILETVNGPLISTNLTSEMVETMEDKKIYSYMIEEKFSHLFSTIIDPGEVEFIGESTIIDFTDSENISVLRQGVGEFNF